jgi:DNA primase
MTSRIPEKIIDEINQRVQLVDVISETVQLKKQGNRYLGLCPFHNEKTPSFTVDPERQLFYCFGCQAGGNLFGFVQKRDNLTFVEAVRQLADQAGIPIPDGDGHEVDEANLRRRQQLLDICQAAMEFFQHQLQYHSEGKEARQYLIKRQLQEETIHSFKIGYAPGGWRNLTDHLVEKGYPLALLEEAGLSLKQAEGDSYYDRFRERIMFPIFDQRGRCIAFGGRVLHDEQPKYLNSPQTLLFDKGRSLYGIHLMHLQKALPHIVVYEGYMDLITAWQGQIPNGVAGLGTALTLDQCRLLKRFASKVILCYDADGAGQRATQRGMQLLRRVGLQVYIARIPAGKDPDEYIRNQGGEAFKQNVIESALPMYQYYMEILKEKFPIESVEGKSAYVREFAAILSQSDSPVEIDGYVQELAKTLQITENAIYREIQKEQRNTLTGFSGKEGTSKPIDEIKVSSRENSSPGNQVAEDTLLRLALYKPLYGKLLTEKLSTEDFDDTYQLLLQEFWTDWKEGISISGTELTVSQNEKISAIIAKLSIEDPGVDMDQEKAFQDCITYLLDQRTKKQLEELTLEFDSLLQEGDMTKMANLLQQIQGLQRKLGRQR